MDSVDYTFRFREKYLAGQLEPAEKLAFEEELGRNPQLLEQLKEQIYLGSMLGEYLGEEGASPSIESEIPPKEIRQTETLVMEKPGVLQRLFAEPARLAAAVAFLLICVWAVWWLGQPNDYQKLATHEFQSFPNEEVKGLRGTLGTQDPEDSLQPEPVDPQKYAAFQAYVKDDYPSALAQLTAFIEMGKDDTGGALFYRGICYMETEQFGLATKDFDEYLDRYLNGDYVEDAIWYMSLANLQEGKVDDAKRRLQELAKKGEKYRGRAGRVLEELGE